jgi:integrase
MPPEPRGAPALELVPGIGYRTRIRFGKGQRERFTIKLLDVNAAAKRDRELRGLARLLTKSGHAEQVPLILGKAAEADDAKLKDIKRWTDRFCRGEAEVDRSPSNTTFGQMAERWTTGKLHQLWPDHIRDIGHETNTVLLDKYVLPVLGDRELGNIAREHCDEVMRQLPAHLAKNSRRHVAKVVSRVLNLAEFAGEIDRNPLPRNWIPSPGGKKDTPVLYPNEDAKLMACTDDKVPLAYRLFYGFLHREGGRRSETARLQWREVDLENGVLQMDINKTDHARWWRLSEGVTEALKAWYELRKRPEPEELVFTDLKGLPLNLDHMADRIRDDLKAAGIARKRLFDRGENTLAFGTHGFRHSFTTRSLANGKSDDWVRQRTGHTTDQLLTYRESAKALEELDMGDLVPLVDAIPELRRASRQLSADESKACSLRRGGPKVGQRQDHKFTKHSRGGQIRTGDPLTPSQVR